MSDQVDRAQRVVRRKTKKQKVPKHLLDGQDSKEKIYLKTDNHRYQLTELLGQGGFGDVYKVLQLETKQNFALKTEKATDPVRKHSRLKIEMTVLKKVADSKELIRKRHFVKIADRGKTSDFKFIVMELVGESLATLQQARKTGRFDLLTSIYLAYQTAEAIDNLHYFGFVHRDVKPQNFTINFGPNPRTIFLLDFGTSRAYIDKSKVMILPRKGVKFVGSPNYASITGLNQKEQGRRDDYESWLYMSVEFFNPDLFTWRDAETLQKMIVAKVKFMTGDALAKSVPKQIILIRDYIQKLKYESAIDIDYIKRLLIKSQKLSSINECIMVMKDGQLGTIKLQTRKSSEHDQEEGSRTCTVSMTITNESTTDQTKTADGDADLVTVKTNEDHTS